MNEQSSRAERLLHMMVPTALTIMSGIGIAVALVLGHELTAAILMPILIIFGLLASGVDEIIADFRRLQLSAKTRQRVRIEADFKVEASPPPSRGRDVA